MSSFAVIEWDNLAANLLQVGLAFLLAVPIGWERGYGRRSVGFRTLPIVAIAACGFALIADGAQDADAETKARVLQGVITGVGFIGGGAILKEGTSVRGLVTAASIWNAGAIGIALAYGRLEIGLVLSAMNFLILVLLTPLDDSAPEPRSDRRG